MVEKRFLIIILIFLFIIVGVFFLNDREKSSKVCFNSSKCINVEIARTPQEKSEGLMYREKLDKETGMLFPYSQEGNYSFWMKNMNFPLDIIWLKGDGRVVYIHENVPPCRVDPCPLYSSQGKSAQYILEVNAGFSQEHKVEVGQKVRFF